MPEAGYGRYPWIRNSDTWHKGSWEILKDGKLQACKEDSLTGMYHR